MSHIYEVSIQFFIQFGDKWFVAITYRSILRGHSYHTVRFIGMTANIGWAYADYFASWKSLSYTTFMNVIVFSFKPYC